jgi:hypothetical protein
VRVNEFHIPVKTPIYVKLRSKDVIHDFDIPTMRVKQDVIPGMEIPIWFEAKEDALTDRVAKEMTKEYSLEGAEWYKMRHLIASADVTAPKGGEVLLAKGADLGLTMQKGDEMISNLRKAGVTKILMQPRNPLEVVCAQLCGNSHFKMKAQLYTHTPEQFAAWITEASKSNSRGFLNDMSGARGSLKHTIAINAPMATVMFITSITMPWATVLEKYIFHGSQCGSASVHGHGATLPVLWAVPDDGHAAARLSGTTDSHHWQIAERDDC